MEIRIPENQLPMACKELIEAEKDMKLIIEREGCPITKSKVKNKNYVSNKLSSIEFFM